MSVLLIILAVLVVEAVILVVGGLWLQNKTFKDMRTFEADLDNEIKLAIHQHDWHGGNIS